MVEAFLSQKSNEFSGRKINVFSSRNFFKSSDFEMHTVSYTFTVSYTSYSEHKVRKF